MKRSRSDDLKEAGMIISNSLGIPSGPADLLRFREEKVLSKVNCRRTYGRRDGQVLEGVGGGDSSNGSGQPGTVNG